MKRRSFSRARLLFALASAAAIAFLLQAVSGLVLWKVLPGGDGGGRFGNGAGEGSFGWDRHTWLDIHDWSGVALVVIILVHVYLHRKWLWHQMTTLVRRR